MNEFQIAFCETNLRWLAGEPESQEQAEKEQKMIEEIKRLKQKDKDHEQPN